MKNSKKCLQLSRNCRFLGGASFEAPFRPATLVPLVASETVLQHFQFLYTSQSVLRRAIYYQNKHTPKT